MGSKFREVEKTGDDSKPLKKSSFEKGKRQDIIEFVYREVTFENDFENLFKKVLKLRNCFDKS